MLKLESQGNEFYYNQQMKEKQRVVSLKLKHKGNGNRTQHIFYGYPELKQLWKQLNGIIKGSLI